MSAIRCESCDNLRNNAPEFVQNGVTDNVCTSLQNDTGLNPSLSTLHNDAEDMHDINDCTIGRMVQEIDAYDVCDWKEFMKKLLPNLYEYNKANNCVDAGQWDSIHAMENENTLLCESIDNMLALIQGALPKAHTGYWLSSFLNKVRVGRTDGQSIPDVGAIFKPSWYADVKEGAGCSEDKKLGRYSVDHWWGEIQYPYSYYLAEFTDNVADGEVMGVIPKSAVPASDYSEKRWNDTCAHGGTWEWCYLNRDTIMYVHLAGHVIIEGVEFNPELAQYGTGNLCIIAGPFIGSSRKGGYTAALTSRVFSYITT